jgi:sugar (pentulose or hexulose) kinase
MRASLEIRQTQRFRLANQRQERCVNTTAAQLADVDEPIFRGDSQYLAVQTQASMMTHTFPRAKLPRMPTTSSTKKSRPRPRAIAVADIGYTNTKLILFSSDLKILAERKIASPHHDGTHYREIDVEPMLNFFASVIPEFDSIAPIDTVVTAAHGACIVCLDDKGKPAVPIMDYMSEPSSEIIDSYTKSCPSFNETFSPQLPVALLHAMQLYWQKRVLPKAFATTRTILPLMQYVAARLGGKYTTEISSMGCQSHLLNMTNYGSSSLAISEGWDTLFAPRRNAWDVVGTLKPEFMGHAFRGSGHILAGVHDSSANYLRYLCGGLKSFTLLSTGTWIIGFNGEADINKLDPERDIVANVDVFGRLVACCRFFGGKEFEIVSGCSNGSDATLSAAIKLIGNNVMALPTFTDSGGPMPGSGKRGRIVGEVKTSREKTSLASLYCALMVSESLDAIHAEHDIIVDGPFVENDVFLQLLAGLRPGQTVCASTLRDGTTAGAACLALMHDGMLPRIDIDMRNIVPAPFDLRSYQSAWRKEVQNA